MVRNYQSRRTQAANSTQLLTNFFTTRTDGGEAADENVNGNQENDEVDDAALQPPAADDHPDIDNQDEVDNSTDESEQEPEPGGQNTQERWSKFNLDQFTKFKNEIDESLRRTGRGVNSYFAGTVPHKFRNVVSPSKDPVDFFGADEHPLTMKHFCVPDLFFWIPEAQYQQFYPNKRPNCKWHKCSDCVIIKGWVSMPRHCYGRHRGVALFGKFYFCRIRKEEKTKPYSFRSYDADAIATANDYNIEIKVRGLPKKYEGLYLGDLIEDEIAKMRSFRNQEPPHPDWISTKSCECTGESFGVMDPVSERTPKFGMGEVDSGSDASLERESAQTADNLLEMEIGIEEDDERLKNIPASSRWLAAQHGRWRPSGRVRTKDEWEFFDKHVLEYQGNTRDEADNYTSINFSAFASRWKKWVASLGSEKPKVTFKTASQLQDAFKSKSKRAIRDSTIRPNVNSLQRLQRNHRGEEPNREFTSQFVEPATASRHVPVSATQDVGTQTDPEQDLDDFFDSIDDTRMTPTQMARLEGNLPPARKKRKQSSGPKAKDRCRKCGKEYESPEWKPMHPIPEMPAGSQNCNLRHQKGHMPHDFCTVPDCDVENGFPALDMAKPMPRRKKQQR